MNLINAKDTSDDYYDSIRYYFKDVVSAQDLQQLLAFLQMQGYEFDKYGIYYEHDHTEMPVSESCYDIESLLFLVNQKGLANISELEMYGNVSGTFFPQKGIVNIFASKKKMTK